MRRTIFLVDMNAFFIACEARRSAHLRDKPAAVAGDPQKRTGIVLAPNYSARSFGIKTAMNLREAMKRCPELITVPPDHRYYSEVSREVMTLLADYSPIVEQNSIDEAWLDMTGTENLFGSPVQAAEQIMDDLKAKLCLWCSIGISENKFLAKMASGIKKPLGITELWTEEVSAKLWPLPVGEMYGIGDKTAQKLNRLKIFTIGDLACADDHQLCRELGNHVLDLKNKANGHDQSIVTSHLREDVKSIGRSTTLAEDSHRPQDLRVILMALAEDVGRRAREYNKKGNTVHVNLKHSDFTTITRQTTLTEPTHYTQEIFQAGYALVEKHWPSRKSVRLVGISLSGFDPKEKPQQLSIFDLTPLPDVSVSTNCQQKADHKILDEVMDEIRNKHGADKIVRASLLKIDMRKE